MKGSVVGHMQQKQPLLKLHCTLPSLCPSSRARAAVPRPLRTHGFNWLSGQGPAEQPREQRYEDDCNCNGHTTQNEQPCEPWATDHEQDQSKERSRKFRRTVYSFERWSKHRSNERYAENMMSIPSSRILTSLGVPLLTLTAFSVTFCAYQTALEAHWLPTLAPSFLLSSPAPLQLTSFALSLLLVFRTNSSYGRFDEARKLWGGVLNHCRNIVQQAVTQFPDEDRAGKAALGRWTVAFSRSLAAHVQEDVDLREELKTFMLPQELDMLMVASSRPVKCLSVLSELVQQSELTAWQRQMFQLDVTFFYDTLGGCERILKTPIPVSYTRHTCRFLMLWLTALPLGLWEHCGWSVVPITATIAMLLLGIEEIGVQIEEPFGILPLESFCERVEGDVRELLGTGGTVRTFVRDLHVLVASDRTGASQAFQSVDGGAGAARRAVPPPPAPSKAAAAAATAAGVRGVAHGGTQQAVLCALQVPLGSAGKDRSPNN